MRFAIILLFVPLHIIMKSNYLVFLTKFNGERDMQVNILEAKTDFSKLIRLLEAKKEESITVARNGKPVAQITLVHETPIANRIGIAKGKFKSPVNFDADNTEIAEMLTGGQL